MVRGAIKNGPHSKFIGIILIYSDLRHKIISSLFSSMFGWFHGTDQQNIEHILHRGGGSLVTIEPWYVAVLYCESRFSWTVTMTILYRYRYTCFLPPYFNLRLLEDSQFRTWLQAQTGSHLWWFWKGNILEHGIHSDLHGPHPKWVTTIFIIFSRCTWHLQNLHVNCLFWMESHSQPSPKNRTSPIKILQIQVGWE